MMMEIKNNNNNIPFHSNCTEIKKEEEIFNLLFCAFFLPLQPVLVLVLNRSLRPVPGRTFTRCRSYPRTRRGLLMMCSLRFPVPFAHSALVLRTIFPYFFHNPLTTTDGRTHFNVYVCR